MEKTIERTFTLKEAFVLWKATSKEGKLYFTGKDVEGKKVTGFYNTNKKNPKEPDMRLIDEKDEEYASLWCNISKNEKKYLNGSLKEGKKLVGFFAKEENEKRPFVRVYFREDEKTEEKPAKKSEKKKEVNDSELPF